MHFTIAAATGFHLMAAMTAHGASRALSGFRGQGQGEVEDAEKSEQDERNYFFVAPLHYLEVWRSGIFHYDTRIPGNLHRIY
jgi:hypothetical protein